MGASQNEPSGTIDDAQIVRQLPRHRRRRPTPLPAHSRARPEHPRDSDGCPTGTGDEWLINFSHVTAIKLVPDRGGSTDALIYVRGMREPIRCCDDGSDIMAALGVPDVLRYQLLAQAAG